MLADEGLFLLHTIGDYATAPTTDPWIEKYIFPNGKLPSARQLTEVLERRFVIEDWQNFGPDYDRTLMAWWDNFEAAWSQLRSRYDQRFYRNVEILSAELRRLLPRPARTALATGAQQAPTVGGLPLGTGLIRIRAKSSNLSATCSLDGIPSRFGIKGGDRSSLSSTYCPKRRMGSQPACAPNARQAWPSGDFLPQGVDRRNAAIQTWPASTANLHSAILSQLPCLGV